MCEPSCIAALSVIDLKNTNTQADEVLFCLFPAQRNDLHGCHNLNQPGTGVSSTAAKYLPEYSCSAVILLVFVTFSVSSHLSNCSVRSISIICTLKKKVKFVTCECSSLIALKLSIKSAFCIIWWCVFMKAALHDQRNKDISELNSIRSFVHDWLLKKQQPEKQVKRNDENPPYIVVNTLLACCPHYQ